MVFAKFSLKLARPHEQTPRSASGGALYFNQPRLRKYSMGTTALAAISATT